jgi:hypothetical protein
VTDAVSLGGGALIVAVAGGGVRRGQVGGQAWVDVSPEGGADVARLLTTADGLLFAGTDTRVFGSSDSGATWRLLFVTEAGGGVLSLNTSPEGDLLVGTSTAVAIGRPR